MFGSENKMISRIMNETFICYKNILSQLMA